MLPKQPPTRTRSLKEGIKVNAVSPGFTSTKLNNYHAAGKTARLAAESLLPWALLDKDGPTCEYCCGALFEIFILASVTGLFFNYNGEMMDW